MSNGGLSSSDKIKEYFIIVYVAEKSSNNHVLEKLQNIVDMVQIFSDLNECVNFITTVTFEKIFVICSSDYEYCFSLIHELPSIESIYTFEFCSNSQAEIGADSCPKFRGSFTDINHLCEEIQMNIRRSANSFIGCQTLNVASTDDMLESRETNQQDALFMYAQLLKEIILLPQSNCEEARQDMIKYCRQCFISNTGQLQFIDEFETNPNERSPVWFYTSESFLYRMLNNSLRVQDVGTLYKLRYFIRQLHEEIVQLQQSQKDFIGLFDHDEHKPYVMLYRGQAIMPKEFLKLQSNIGGLLSVSNFLSTSTKENVGRFFAEMTLADPTVISVCMNIRVKTISDGQISKMAPFSCINKISRFGETEDEVLLSMGSVFRIESIDQSSNGIWFVNLTLTGDEDQQLRLVRESLQTRITCDDPLLSLGKLMYSKGDYQKAIDFFEQLLDDKVFLSYLPNQSVIHNELAQNYKQIGNLNRARQLYEIALTIARQHPTGNCDDQYVAGILNNQGMIYLTEKNYTKALEYFEQAFCSCTAHPTPHLEHMSIYLNNIGLVQNRLKNFEQSLIFYEKSLMIKREILPANHPAIANTLCNIGELHAQQGRYEQAMDLYKETLRIEKATLPPDHPSLALTHAHIGEVLVGMGRYQDAIKEIELAIAIDSMNLPGHNSLLDFHRGRLDRVQKLLTRQSGQS